MRTVYALFTTAALTACAAAPPEPYRTAEKQNEYQQLVGDKVAQAPISCLPHQYSTDMRVIDDSTIVFRAGASRSYVAHLPGGCSNLSRGNYALVTRQYGSADLCRGDIAQVVDVANRFTVGSCAFGDFTPYERPRTQRP